MFKVVFEDAYYERHDIALCDTQDAAFKAISEFIKEQNINPHYYRHWVNDEGETVVDYGSHSSFCIIIPMILEV